MEKELLQYNEFKWNIERRQLIKKAKLLLKFKWPSKIMGHGPVSKHIAMEVSS